MDIPKQKAIVKRLLYSAKQHYDACLNIDPLRIYQFHKCVVLAHDIDHEIRIAEQPEITM